MSRVFFMFEECFSWRLFVDELVTKMDDNNFIDLPTLRTIDITSIGMNFVARGMVDRDAWSTVSTVIQDGGFYSMIPHFRSAINDLKRLTQQLRQEALQLCSAVQAGQMNCVLEENRAGNIKTTFAMLYSGWNRFNALFLASSLLSTEVWYAFRKHGMLADPAVQIRVA